jgi:acyl-CoA hydrolase
MLRLLRSGTMTVASATAFSLSDDGLAGLRANIAAYRDKIILRPHEISNHLEVIRRLGCLAMNGMIEADITEQGIADLRGLPPRRRARQIIDHCAHPGYRPALQHYLDRAAATGPGRHTPHPLGEALSWHVRYLKEGTMRPG